ncbi:E3 ubiquitin-protein ligase XIAP [Pimephales promelas]|nr:E3 ubiquitin-protein ligase XIAP [Pimephales promelas]
MEGSVSNVEICNLAYTGKFEELKGFVLSDSALATKTDQDNRTALHWACSAGHADIVQFLLELGVDVNIEDDACWTPLHIAASAGREKIVRSLISKGAQLNSVNQNGCTPLHYAASKDRFEIAQILLENGADPNATDKLQSTPLHRASSKGNYRLIQLLLKESASTNIQDSEGNTPLHLACDEGRAEAAKLLVEHGASIYIENKEKMTPLQVAKERRSFVTATMAHSSEDGDYVADGEVGWSSIDHRLNSFQHFPHFEEISAERLARAGFYFTGEADKVCCFSCHATVEDWNRGDTPLKRHQQASPGCKFLSCAHGLRSSNLVHSPAYDEVAEARDFLLRTGGVVDQTIYPTAPHMKSEEARLYTFSDWPADAPVQPEDLAGAGMYYYGTNDKVQCFCCGGILEGWEQGDDAWDEHAKHYPNCFFILGHDAGNVPLTTPRPRLNGRMASMETYEGRLESFRGRQHPIDPERLARAGFYSTGVQDRVICFRCGGGVKDWIPEEDPWEEHAKHYPGCSFLRAEKGGEYVSNIQLRYPNGVHSVSNFLSFTQPLVLQLN